MSKVGASHPISPLMYYKLTVFPFPNYQHVYHTDRIKYLGRVKYYVTSALLFIDMFTLAHQNYTGIEQVIQLATWRF